MGEKRYLVSVRLTGRWNLGRFYCSLLDELEPGEVFAGKDVTQILAEYERG